MGDGKATPRRMSHGRFASPALWIVCSLGVSSPFKAEGCVVWMGLKSADQVQILTVPCAGL